MESIASRLKAVTDQINSAILASGRAPGSVDLLAVSKTFGPDAVLEAVRVGHRTFGENYVQEALDKITALQALAPDVVLSWHFIGPLQSNKTKPVAEHFDWVHTVDREKIARRLSEQRPAGMSPVNICLQINVSGEESKSGIVPDEALSLAQVVSTLPGLRLRGLMAIPAPTEEVAEQHAAFARLRQLRDNIVAAGIPLDTLSMGMSSDLVPAITEGATIVRVGSAIFGQRHYV